MKYILSTFLIFLVLGISPQKQSKIEKLENTINKKNKEINSLYTEMDAKIVLISSNIKEIKLKVDSTENHIIFIDTTKVIKQGFIKKIINNIKNGN